MLVFIIAAILLGTAYYKVTAGVRTISDFQGLGIQIAKGIMEPSLYSGRYPGCCLQS